MADKKVNLKAKVEWRFPADVHGQRIWTDEAALPTMPVDDPADPFGPVAIPEGAVYTKTVGGATIETPFQEYTIRGDGEIRVMDREGGRLATEPTTVPPGYGHVGQPRRAKNFRIAVVTPAPRTAIKLIFEDTVIGDTMEITLSPNWNIDHWTRQDVAKAMHALTTLLHAQTGLPMDDLQGTPDTPRKRDVLEEMFQLLNIILDGEEGKHADNWKAIKQAYNRL